MSDDEVKVIVKAKKTNAASKGSGHQLFVVSISANTDVAWLEKKPFISSYLNEQPLQRGALFRLQSEKNILCKKNQITFLVQLLFLYS